MKTCCDKLAKVQRPCVECPMRQGNGGERVEDGITMFETPDAWLGDLMREIAISCGIVMFVMLLCGSIGFLVKQI